VTAAPFFMRLEEACDADFDWLGGMIAAPKPLRVAPELSPPEVLAIVRTLPANWLMVVDDEVVGIIGIKAWSEDRKSAEVGYGTAASRRGLGHAKQAVAHLIGHLQEVGLVSVTAETSVDNLASQRVLLMNGFVEVGRRVDEEDGLVICWQRSVEDA
jgi:RimJ/RimL family protein N-acetyltransferase